MPLAKKFTKSLLSGGTAAFVYLALTYTLTEFLGVYYLISVLVSFLVGIVLNFSLQKLWVFGEKSRRGIPRQLFFFILLVIGNVGVSTASIYYLVEMRGMWYVHAQILMIAVFAVVNFILYHLVFKSEAILPDAT